jgi:hypothetical protein
MKLLSPIQETTTGSSAEIETLLLSMEHVDYLERVSH